MGSVPASWRKFGRIRTAAAVMILSSVPGLGSANDFCPDVYDGGVLPLNFNPAFMHVDRFTQGNGQNYDDLLVTSFFNAIKEPDGSATIDYFERDLVARIPGIGYKTPAWWNPDRDVEVISDFGIVDPVLPSGPIDPADGGQTVWPNEAQGVPDGILPFQAVIVPEGFHTAGPPGRMTIINLDDPNRETYLVDQSTQQLGQRCYGKPDGTNDANAPHFYHLAKWWDMDGDGLKDIISVRSKVKVNKLFCIDGVGEVVWFKNPGANLDPDVEWDEFVIAGYPTNTYSADISLDVADLEGDGIPEIVGGAFFASITSNSAVEIYGAPVGGDWTDVDLVTNPPRVATLSTKNTNGQAFGVRFTDLNNDGKLEVLATNHQKDNCFSVTQDPIPGRVWAMQQPANGDIFGTAWTTRILKDNIRPNPTFPTPAGGPGRLAPGIALEFWPTPFDENFHKPWVLVGGDESSKVWLLKPNSEDPNDWSYSSTTIFDINDYYGPNASQEFSAPAPATGVSISTIGFPAWRYDRDWAWGSYAEIYIPVFEGRDIHRITFRPLGASKKIACPADVNIACPVP